MNNFRYLEINGGRVQEEGIIKLWIPNGRFHYTDAQIDDYGRSAATTFFPRRHFPWRAGSYMKVTARFSHSVDTMLGTAGFGFWNAPFADPSLKWPTLPEATWFFFGSEPTDLPLAPTGSGQGWFAGTLNTRSFRAKMLIPFAPFVVLGNQSIRFRNRVWPFVQNHLGISYRQLPDLLTEWHTYELFWQDNGCCFIVDGESILETIFSPTGPLGFVCWVDNQYMVVRENGRFQAGILSIPQPQWMEISTLEVATASPIKPA
jgi:hypothetical protein